MSWRNPGGDDYNLPKYRRQPSRNPVISFPRWLWLVAPLSASLLTNGYFLYLNWHKTFKEELLGTWLLVPCESAGAKSPPIAGRNPAGLYIFTRDGHFSFQTAAEFPKFESGDRMEATPQENRAAVQGSIAYYGTYAVNDGEKTIGLHIERSSFPDQNGTEEKLTLTALSRDEMKFDNIERKDGGSISCFYRRAK